MPSPALPPPVPARGHSRRAAAAFAHFFHPPLHLAEVLRPSSSELSFGLRTVFDLFHFFYFIYVSRWLLSYICYLNFYYLNFYFFFSLFVCSHSPLSFSLTLALNPSQPSNFTRNPFLNLPHLACASYCSAFPMLFISVATSSPLPVFLKKIVPFAVLTRGPFEGGLSLLRALGTWGCGLLSFTGS